LQNSPSGPTTPEMRLAPLAHETGSTLTGLASAFDFKVTAILH
jgi:hypothetical protein